MRDHPPRDRGPADYVGIDSAAIVAADEQDSIVAAAHLQANLTGGRFAGGGAGLWILDTVGNGIVHGLQQGVAQQAERVTIDSGFAADRGELDLLVERLRRIAGRAFERGEKRRHRQQAQAAGALAHFRERALRMAESVIEPARKQVDVAGQFGGERGVSWRRRNRAAPVSQLVERPDQRLAQHVRQAS